MKSCDSVDTDYQQTKLFLVYVDTACVDNEMSIQCFDQMQAIKLSLSGLSIYAIQPIPYIWVIIMYLYRILNCTNGRNLLVYDMQLQIGQLAYSYHFESHLKI